MYSGRAIEYGDVVALATDRFVAGRRVPMLALCRELAISRATLYRVVGSRDQLLGDVLWGLAEFALHHAVRKADAEGLSGVDRLEAVSYRFHVMVADFEPMQRFLHREPADAFRILFSESGGVHRRVVDAWEALIQAEFDAGALPGLAFDAKEAAYVFVRIGESVLYGDVMAGISPDRRLVDSVRRTLLNGGQRSDHAEAR